MNLRTSLVCSALALCVGLASVPAAFAMDDAMMHKDSMKKHKKHKDSMKGDAMKGDSMKKEDAAPQ